jgi:ABC-type uncharacterized transport system involved in gliding motility auxiliary subunit
MNTQWLKARQTKYATYATVYILVIVAVIVVANVLADRYNKSIDTTANKRYSVSDQTAKIVRELKQPATITYFNQTTRFQQAKDLLDQYQNLSRKIHVQYMDPDKKPLEARAAVMAAGLKELPYGTTLVQVGNRVEEAKSLTEEGITGALIRDLKHNVRTVCFVSGSGEAQLDDTDRSGLSALKDQLGKENYQTKTINLLQKAEVPSDCTVIVVAGPTSDYQQPEVDALKKYVEDGGRALFMVEPPLNMGRLQIADNPALTNLLQSWGVTLDKDLVLDLNPMSQLAGLGPDVALVMSYPSQPIVTPIKGKATGFPLARTMQIKNADKTSVEKLIETSESSLATNKINAPVTENDLNDPKNKKGPLTIAAAGTYNTGKENVQGRFVVFGSARWAENRFLGFNGNVDLALNTINWLASDEDLISIRPKPEDDRRITMTQGQIRMVTYFSQFIMPLAVVLGGVGVWMRRRKG